MKAAVYDHWWSTAGGGEKFAAGIAQVLARDFDVELLAHEPVDLDTLAERLQLDLSGVGLRVLELGQPAVEDASGDYDLFVNASYTSSARNNSPAGLYVVHFPTPPPADPPGWRASVKRAVRPLVAEPGTSLRLERGFHPPERIAKHRVQWTDGDATIELRVPPGAERWVTIGFGKFFDERLPPQHVTVEVDGTRARSVALRAPESRFELPVVRVTFPVTGHDDGTPVRVRLVGDAHSPQEQFGSPDTRSLGVPVTGVQVGSGPRAKLRERYPSLAEGPGGLDWVHSYQRVVSNSRYTAEWVQRWWGITTEVLNPPVTSQDRGTKEKMILNVGRFFAPEHGHCKKQLDLVRAMRALVWRGKADGWTLHLVGGVSEADRPYLEKVEREAADLPVVVHVAPPGSEVRDLYSRASIYWHASGLGEDPDTQPDRFEHFGITTVEAMSAGAVPVVIRAAGQLEVVEHGVSGLHWEPLVQLVCFTEDLILDPERLAKMSAAAEARARGYEMEAFGDRVTALAAQLVPGVDGSPRS